jgi:hypothetical protein
MLPIRLAACHDAHSLGRTAAAGALFRQFQPSPKDLRRIAAISRVFPPRACQIGYNALLPFSTVREPVMTDAERQILRYFKKYRIGANEMLFFNTSVTNTSSSKFNSAMDSLIRNGLVVRERRRNAYSLTDDGFAVSQSA